MVALYDQLLLDPSPIIALNRAIAVAEIEGPEVTLRSVDRLGGKLADYHAVHATCADLLRRLERRHEAAVAYERAIELAGNTAKTAYLSRRRDELRGVAQSTDWASRPAAGRFPSGTGRRNGSIAAPPTPRTPGPAANIGDYGSSDIDG